MVHSPIDFSLYFDLFIVPYTFPLILGNPPMAKHRNLLGTKCVYNKFAFVWYNKILRPPIKLPNRYASSQIYTFSKTKRFCSFQRSG